MVTMNVTWGIHLLLAWEFLGCEVECPMAGSRAAMGPSQGRSLPGGLTILWHHLPGLCSHQLLGSQRGLPSKRRAWFCPSAFCICFPPSTGHCRKLDIILRLKLESGGWAAGKEHNKDLVWTPWVGPEVRIPKPSGDGSLREPPRSTSCGTDALTLICPRSKEIPCAVFF